MCLLQSSIEVLLPRPISHLSYILLLPHVHRFIRPWNDWENLGHTQMLFKEILTQGSLSTKSRRLEGLALKCYFQHFSGNMFCYVSVKSKLQHAHPGDISQAQKRKLQFCKQPFKIIQGQIAFKNTAQYVTEANCIYSCCTLERSIKNWPISRTGYQF